MQMSYLYSSDLPFKYTRQTSRNRSQKQVLVMIKHFLGNSQIDQLRYIKIQSQTIDLSTRLWWINPTNSSYSREPRTEVYCFRLNLNISKLVYCRYITNGFSGRFLSFVLSICQGCSLFLFFKNVVIDENAQMKKQLEVMEEKEVCNDFIFAVAFVVINNYLLTSSHLLCVYA